MKKLAVLSFAFLTLAACGSDDNSYIEPITPASEGTTFGTTEHPLNIGGSSQRNQVYVDLSGETAVDVARDSWDLGFYSGSDFRVVLNGSVAMAVKQLETSDINAVVEEDGMVAVGTFQASNMAYIDTPTGSLDATAFGTIAANETEAKVYIVNLGLSVPTGTVGAGTANTAGPARGWKKVKVWQNGNGYTLQYANLDDVSATKIDIAKDAAYNHVFFSLTTGATVKAEPQKANWDLNFSTFTNEVFDGTASAGAYFYSDFILLNTKAGVTAVKVQGDTAAYTAFNKTAYDTGSYTFSTDQRAIGADWRDVFTRVVFDNVFFLVKDAEGNIYKVRFISMVSSSGERGFPVFEYEILK